MLYYYIFFLWFFLSYCFLAAGGASASPQKKIGENIQKSIDKIDEPCYNQVNNPKGGGERK